MATCASARSGRSRAGEPREVLTVAPPIVGFARGHHGEVFVIRQGEPIMQLGAD